MNQHHVFVYGTLRKGECNHFLLSKAKLVLPHCWTYGVLYDTGEGYPCMLPHAQQRVIGEVYAVTDEELERLDELEGYCGPGKNNLYDRISQIVYSGNREILAQLYVYADDNSLDLEIIESGDWVQGK